MSVPTTKARFSKSSAIEKIDKITFLNKNLSYLKSCCASNQKELSEEMASPPFISSKRALSTDSSQSYSQNEETTTINR